MLSSLLKKCNIVTFIGIAFSIAGICFCYNHLASYAILMMVLAGICDGFDGPISRKINKGSNEYGIQLDSLADIIGSGILPINICLSLGYTAWYNGIIYAIFILCGIIRLSYYNVNSSSKEYFEGIPITCSTMLITLVYLLIKNEIAFMVALVALSILFVSGFKIKKPSMKMRIFMSAFGIFCVVMIFIFIR